MIREINVKEITKNIKEMCIEANYTLSPDMDKAMKKAAEEEKSELGTKILNQLQENLVIADSKKYRSVRIPEWQLYLWISDRKFISRVDNWKKQSTKESVRDIQKDILENPL